MAILTRKAIKQANDIPKELVSIPEWGGEVYVRAMTAVERDRFERSMMRQVEGEEPVSVRALLAFYCCVDENGNHIFDQSDLPMLESKNAAVVGRISEKARQLSILTKQEVEEMEKNSEGDKVESSNSDFVSN